MIIGLTPDDNHDIVSNMLNNTGVFPMQKLFGVDVIPAKENFIGIKL